MRETTVFLLKKLLICFCLALFLQSLGITSWGQTYDLDYDVLSEGGGSAGSSNYELIAVINANGIEAETQSSTSYSVESVVSKQDSKSIVSDWMLY